MAQHKRATIDTKQMYSTIKVSNCGISKLNGIYSLKSWSKPLIYEHSVDRKITIFRTAIPEMSLDKAWVIAELSHSNVSIHHYIHEFPSLLPPASSWECVAGIEPPPNIQQIRSNQKQKKSSDLKDIKLPPTPSLLTAMVNVPWTESPIQMKILMFYHSKPHIFGCQFSNLFKSPISADPRWIVPTKDGTVQTLLNYEKSEMKEDDSVNTLNLMKFKSSESIFQAAKAKYKGDALFVQSLSPGDAARAGQGRLRMNRKIATKYREQFGGNPVETEDGKWQIRKSDVNGKSRYEVRDKWHEYKLEIMHHALRIKFGTHQHLIQEYVEGEIPVFFVEHTSNDKQWGDNYDGKGTNYLGKFLTALAWNDRIGKKSLNTEAIDTMADSFLEWLKKPNYQVIEDGETFYAQNADCPWLR